VSQDGEPLRSELRVEARFDGSETVIVIEGDLDRDSVPRFLASVSDALNAHPGTATIDARGITFVDSSGLQGLINARVVARDAGGTLRVVEPSPALLRVARRAGVMDLLSHP
jgi:anti-anti-sigma factor